VRGEQTGQERLPILWGVLSDLTLAMFPERSGERSTQGCSQEGRDRIPDLAEAARTKPCEAKVIGETLDACGFTHGEGAELVEIRVDVSVAILRQVGGDGATGLIPPQFVVPIGKLIAAIPR
jgi:hypothetical protein